MKRTIITFLLVSAICINVNAYDFIVNYMEYTKNSDGTSVTLTRVRDYSSTGTIIPQNVSYNGKTYSVTAIGDYALANCGVSSVTIPSSVTSIGHFAFQNCRWMNSVTIPGSVTYIGQSAFEYCESLKSVTIPNSVISIERAAFSNCTSLTSIKIPNSVTKISDSTFDNCTNLATVTIGNSVSSIGPLAFRCCKGLTSITIPHSVNIIGGDAFYECSNLKTVTIPNSVWGIYAGGQPFRECNINQINISCKDNNDFANYLKRDDIFKIFHTEIKEGINHSIYIAGKKQTVITIPESVTTIGDYAFCYCDLTSVTIPKSVTSIGKEAFDGCSGLTSVTIPNSVTNIGDYAFGECYSLMEIHSKIKQPGKGITYGRSIFYKAPIGSILLFIPKGTKTLYNNTSPWNQFINIVEEDDSGINDIKVDVTPTEDVYYNLHGQRVFNPTPGIYIHNGKKELVR